MEEFITRWGQMSPQEQLETTKQAVRFCMKKGLITERELQMVKEDSKLSMKLALQAVIRQMHYQKIHGEE